MTGQFASSVSHMIAIYRMLGACLFVVCIFPVWAQGQSPAPVLTPSLRRVNTSPGRPGSGNAATALSCNYVITLTVLADEKPLGEVVLLTASPTVRTNVPLNGRADGSSVSASGDLSETEIGEIAFAYALDFTVVIPPGDDARPAQGGARIQYQNHSSIGTVLAKLGKQYDLLKAGGRVYRFVIDKAKNE